MMTANELTLGQTAQIVACTDPSMMDLGVLPGESLEILNSLLFGSAKVVRVGTSTFAFRPAELESIRVELI
jgi:Fe2+ transport system protein FeoA